MSRQDLGRIARALSPTQRHCLLRFSDAEDWDHSGYGMPRTWPDLVAGKKRAQHRSLRALVRLDLAEEVDAVMCSGFRLTPLGLSVQLHARRLDR